MRRTASKRVLHPPHPSSPEDGFLLLGLIVAIAIILITLAIAAPTVARSLRRDKELEAVHRGNQYVRAIQLYYRKLGHYPGTIEQLENTNNLRFLRQRYVDPMTGKPFRTIPVGQNKTTVKGFFGQPLAGIATTGVGSVGGMVSPGIGSGNPTGASPIGGGNALGAGFGGGGGIGGTSPIGGAYGANAASGATGAPGAAGATGASGASGASGSSGGTGSTFGQSATSFSGTAQPFMGVGLDAKGDSIIELNEQTTYDTWEFLYDPRIEQLKAKAGLNSAPGGVNAGSLGQPFGATGSTGPTTPGATTPAAGSTGPTGTPPTTPP